MTEELPDDEKFYKRYWKIIFDLLFVGLIPISLFSVSILSFSRAVDEEKFRAVAIETLVLGGFFTIILIPVWRMILRVVVAPDPVIELRKDGFYLRCLTQELIPWDKVEFVREYSSVLTWFLVSHIHFRLKKGHGLECQKRRFGRIARNMITFALFSKSGMHISMHAEAMRRQHSAKA